MKTVSGPPRLIAFFREISVEPSCFIYFFVYSIYTIGAQRLVLHKTCSPDKMPPIEEFCRNPELVGKASDINTVRNMIGEALPGLVVFIGGAWRDATGLSRPLMFYTFISEFISTGVFLLAAIFWSLPMWPVSIIESTITGFGGGKQLVNLAAVCIISNRTTEENRTFRLTFFIISMIGGFCVANAVSGFVLNAVGYTAFFAGIMAFLLTAFVLGLIFIKEEPNKLKKGEKWLDVTKLKVVFKQKRNRAVVWLMIINSWLIYTTQTGEENVMLYFLERAFGLTVTQCGFYLAYIMSMNLISTVCMSPILIKILKWSDFTISIVGIISIIAATVGLALSKSIVLLCIFAAVDIMRYSVVTVQRSIITKCVSDEDLGTYWSFVGLGESFVPMVTLPIYETVFKETLTNFIGAHYFVSTGLALAAFVNICVARQLFKNSTSEDKPADNIPTKGNIEEE